MWQLLWDGERIVDQFAQACAVYHHVGDDDHLFGVGQNAGGRRGNHYAALRKRPGVAGSDGDSESSPTHLLWPLVPNFAWGVWLAIGLAVLVAVLLHNTVFGRHLFAIGSNEATARLCGIPVARTKILIYMLSGLCIGIAGIYHFARLTKGDATAGLGLELRVIAAVVIGGGSLSGGRGSVIGTLCGAAIMTVISHGCTALGLENQVEDILLGVIIVAAVSVDRLRTQQRA